MTNNNDLGSPRAARGWGFAPVALIVTLTLIKTYFSRDVDGFYFWAIDCLFFFGVGAYLAISSARMDWADWHQIPNQKFGIGIGKFCLWTLALVLAVTLCIALVLVTTRFATQSLHIELAPPLAISYPDALPTHPLVRWPVIAYAAISAGLIEEWLYRARVANILAINPADSNMRFVLISSALFACAHLCHGTKATLVAFFVGTLMAVYFQKAPIANRLLSLALAHALVDLKWLASAPQ